MITFLQGPLVEKAPDRAVMDVGGVGYEILIPLSSFERLPALNATCRIFIHDYVREDQHVLYGFMTEGERRLFGMLMSVNGIGPKLAISALSCLSVRELTTAIAGGDVRRLNTISGIGKKIAARLVVDLRDKIGAGAAAEADTRLSPEWAGDQRLRDAIMALIALGYKQAEAQKMIAAVAPVPGEELTVESLVRKALAR